MSGNRLSRMHGSLVRTDGGATALLGTIASGIERYAPRGRPVPRSSRRKPMDEYWVFLPNRDGYEDVATHYIFRNPKSLVTMDGNRFVIRTHNYSDRSAITGVLHVGKGGRLTKKEVATDGGIETATKTLGDYFADGLDVVKASDVFQPADNYAQITNFGTTKPRSS